MEINVSSLEIDKTGSILGRFKLKSLENGNHNAASLTAQMAEW